MNRRGNLCTAGRHPGGDAGSLSSSPKGLIGGRRGQAQGCLAGRAPGCILQQVELGS